MSEESGWAKYARKDVRTVRGTGRCGECDVPTDDHAGASDCEHAGYPWRVRFGIDGWRLYYPDTGASEIER